MKIPNDLDAEQELTILSFAIRLLLANLDRELLIERGLESFADFGQCNRVAVFLLDQSCETLTAEGCIGSNLEASSVQLSVAGTPFEEVIQTKQPGKFQLSYFDGTPCPTSHAGLPDRQCLCVPLIEANNRAIGVVTFDQPAGESLDEITMQCILVLQSVLAISLENARVLDQLQQAHAELKTLYQAKTKMIDHLSHELKTPLAIISASSKLLHKPSIRMDEKRLPSLLGRMERSVERLLQLEEEASDIAKRRDFQEKPLLERMIRQCQDLLETLVQEQDPPNSLLLDLARRIEELYLPPRDHEETNISLHLWIPELLAAMEPLYRHRKVRLELDLKQNPAVRMPEAPLYKAFSGLVRNAIENTPDRGTIRIELDQRDGTLCLRVRDFGVGLEEEVQKQLFHGFIHSGDTQDYSSGRPFDFRAGGKGLDLLRTKLFSERYGFDIQVESRYGIGSLFSLEFPASMLSPEPENTSKREGHEKSSRENHSKRS